MKPLAYTYDARWTLFVRQWKAIGLAAYDASRACKGWLCSCKDCNPSPNKDSGPSPNKDSGPSQNVDASAARTA